MKIKTVTRYTCDFCKKNMYSKGGMTRHELRCTLNPNRKCSVCALQEGWAEDHQGLAEIIALIPLPNFEQLGPLWHEYYQEHLLPKMPEIRAAAANCPACLMAAFRQSRIPLSMLPCFNFTEEMEVIFKRKNEERQEDMENIAGYGRSGY